MAWLDVRRGIKLLGHIGAPVLATVTTYLHDEHMFGWELVSALAAAYSIPLFAQVGSFVSRSAREQTVWAEVLDTIAHRILRAPVSSDPNTPSLRVTVFYPEIVAGEPRFVARYRLHHGEKTIRILGSKDCPHTRFAKDEAIIGEAWSTRTQCIKNVRSVSDFSGTDAVRLELWIAQWRDLGASQPGSWSPYMRGVRSIWAIPIRDLGESVDKSLGPIAIICIDTPEANAFVEASLPTDTFHGVSMNEAVEAHISGLIYSNLYGSKLSTIRSAILSLRRKKD